MRIHHIEFGEGAVEIGYTDFPADVRVKGAVVMMRQVTIDLRHPDYREDGDLLMAQAARMLRNVLEDFEDSEPHQPAAEPDDDDDDEGMGMGYGDKS
jgi:hypothetical protein